MWSVWTLDAAQIQDYVNLRGEQHFHYLINEMSDFRFMNTMQNDSKCDSKKCVGRFEMRFSDRRGRVGDLGSKISNEMIL